MLLGVSEKDPGRTEVVVGRIKAHDEVAGEEIVADHLVIAVGVDEDVRERGGRVTRRSSSGRRAWRSSRIWPLILETSSDRCRMLIEALSASSSIRSIGSGTVAVPCCAFCARSSHSIRFFRVFEFFLITKTDRLHEVPGGGC